MSRVETVAESWQTYRAAVVPQGASPAQVEETRRAFYAGSYFMLMNVAYNIGDDTTSEEEGIEHLEQLKAECETFAKSVGQPLPTPVETIAPPDIHYTVPDPLDIQTKLKELAAFIKDDLPEGWGFTLLLFSYGEKGSLFYISSAERADVLNVMREFIRRQTQ